MTPSLQSAKECQKDPALGELIQLATEGLEQMFDSEKRSFCFRLMQTKTGIVREGISIRYTIIALLGLCRLEASGGRSPVDIRVILTELLTGVDYITNIGDLGLLLWLCALVSPNDLSLPYHRLDLNSTLDRYEDARQRRTMELAWFLSGLAHRKLACTKDAPQVADLALRTYELIKDNQGQSGIFGHLHRKRSFSGLLRGRIGSFADQVYPIYALSKFAQAYHVPEAVELALKCAASISRAQGPLGQWWWHYDSSTGEIRGHYPVYSVHQHGMAPMALFALSEASRKDFDASISKGLQWISGNNEIGFDFRSNQAKVVWRSLYNRRRSSTLDATASFLRYHNDLEPPDNLSIRFECWSYELGWLLYAFAGTKLHCRAHTP